MAKARTELIHCDNCGEDYADTYRRCPFCNAKAGQRRQEPADEGGYETYDASHRGGKRLAGGRQPRRGGNGHPVKTALYILASLVILAAIWIMCSMVIPRILNLGSGTAPTPAVTDPVVTQTPPAPTPETAPSPDTQPTSGDTADLPDPDDPLALDSPDLPPVIPDPAVVVSQTPSATPSAQPTPAGLRLSSTDFTLSPRYPTYQLEIAGVGRAKATYSIKNEAVATVNATGLVTAVGDGWTNLTVTDEAGTTATCIVRVSGMNAPTATQASAGEAPAATQTPASETPASEASAGSAHLNRTDFSISAQFPDPYRLRVVDGQAASWASKNPKVATVSDNGTVTAVGNGHTTITCTLTDGSTLTCEVHVSGK